MSTPPFAQVQVSIAGGGNVSGGVTAAFGQSVALSATNTTGWTAAIWEIYDYPPGFSAPAGWSTSAANVVYFQPTNPTTAPPSFNLPASGSNNWGKFAIRLRINNNPLQRNANGSPNAAFVPQYTDEATIVRVPSPTLGLPGVCFNETTQFDALRAAVGDLMACLRKLDVTFGGGGTVSVTGSGLLHATGSVLDGAAYKGTAGQLLVTNAGATDTAWVSGSGDVSTSAGTPGQFTVTGLQTHAVPAPSGTNTALLWSGSAFSWGNSAVSVTGSGLLHSTSGALDAAAYRGTAGQALFTNAGATDTQWASFAGDVSASVSTVGQLTVTGIQAKSVPVPTGTNTVLTWSGSALSWASVLGVTGSGLVHVTSSSIDASASRGTAGQALFTNAGATDTQWASFAGDVTGSTSSPGTLTVVGIRNSSVPSPTGTNTVLTWSGSALSWASAGSGVTWANDLAGNGTTTNTNQYVSSLSFSSSAAGGTIAVNGTNTTLQWASGGTNAGLSQASTASATGHNITIQSQASTASPGTPGNIILNTPDKVGAGNVGYTVFEGNGGEVARIGAWNNSNGGAGAIYLGPIGAPTIANYILFSDGSNVSSVNGPVTLQLVAGGGGSSPITMTQNGVQFGAYTQSLGGGTTVIGISNVTTLPTSLPSNGLLAYANTGSPGSLGLLSGGIAFHRLASPLISQDTPTSDVGTTTMVISAQNAFATAATNLQGAHLHLASGTGATTNGTGGNVRVKLPAPTGSGTESAFQVQRAGVVEAQVQYITSNIVNMWLGTGAGSLNNTNMCVQCDGATSAIFNAPGASGKLFLSVNGGIPGVVILTTSGTQFFPSDGFTQQLGGGSQVIGLSDATTSPTAAPAAGNGILWERATSFRHLSSDNVTTYMAPATFGTPTTNTQRKNWKFFTTWIRTTATGAVTFVNSYATFSSSNTNFFVYYNGRDTNGGTAASGIWGYQAATNNVGAVTATSSNINSFGTSPTLSSSTGTNTVSLTINPNSATTLDWQFFIFVNEN